MQTNTTRHVSDIPAGERLAFEGMLGSPLASDQHVIIVAYVPGVVPSDSARVEAKQRLEKLLVKNHSYAQQHGITAAHADEAIAEAMQQSRRRD